ncbi:MAG: serine protease, partial [bacterium]|nr:serine protease [bacterium]
EGGCVNGDTQYAAIGTGWQRATVPDTGNYISMGSFDPATGLVRVQRWLPDGDTMDKARALLKDKPIKGCASDPAMLGRIATLQSDLSALLPAQPNERLVYHCQKGRLVPRDAAQ